MTDSVEVPFDGEAEDKAVLLLAAAEELDLDASVVQTTAGAFLVPQEVHDQAFGPRDDDPSKKPATKRAATKKK